MNKSDELFGGEGNVRAARPTKHIKFKTNNKLTTAASQDQSQAPQQETRVNFQKGFLWGGSDCVDHVAIEVLQDDVAIRGSRYLFVTTYRIDNHVCILLGIVEAQSVDVKNTTTTSHEHKHTQYYELNTRA